MDDPIETIRAHLLEHYLQGVKPERIKPATPLITGGLMRSADILQAVTFLERRFGIQIGSDEIHPDNLDTLEDMARFVAGKQSP